MNLAVIAGGPVTTNAYLVADDQGQTVVIDVGFEPERLQPVLEQNGWQVAAIVSTHSHFDHVAGNAAAVALWQVPLYMHEAAVPLATHAAEQAQWFGLTCADSPEPDRLLAAGDRLEVGQLSFEVRHAPGHCPGHVLLIGDGHAFVGDVIFAGGIGRWDLPLADGAELMRSIREQVMTLPDTMALHPGHGESTTVGDERRGNPYRDMWEREQ